MHILALALSEHLTMMRAVSVNARRPWRASCLGRTCMGPHRQHAQAGREHTFCTCTTLVFACCERGAWAGGLPSAQGECCLYGNYTALCGLLVAAPALPSSSPVVSEAHSLVVFQVHMVSAVCTATVLHCVGCQSPVVSEAHRHAMVGGAWDISTSVFES